MSDDSRLFSEDPRLVCDQRLKSVFCCVHKPEGRERLYCRTWLSHTFSVAAQDLAQSKATFRLPLYFFNSRLVYFLLQPHKGK